MSIKIVAQLHPFKTDLTILDRNTAPLSELYADLGVQADIRNARMLIADRKSPISPRYLKTAALYISRLSLQEATNRQEREWAGSAV